MEKEFLKIFNNISTSISVFITGITNVLGIEWIFFAGYLILNIFDYITGILKSRVKQNEKSMTGLSGIIKKICYWILILIAFLISFLLYQIGIKMNLQLDFVMFFGWFTLICLIINETRSILENLVEIGIKVPNFLIRGLEIYSNYIDSKLDKNSNSKDN